MLLQKNSLHYSNLSIFSNIIEIKHKKIENITDYNKNFSFQIYKSQSINLFPFFFHLIKNKFHKNSLSLYFISIEFKYKNDQEKIIYLLFDFNKILWKTIRTTKIGCINFLVVFRTVNLKHLTIVMRMDLHSLIVNEILWGGICDL